MGGQHCVVQHVWIGEDVPGLLPGESTLGVVGVTVEGGNQPVARPDLATDPRREADRFGVGGSGSTGVVDAVAAMMGNR